MDEADNSEPMSGKKKAGWTLIAILLAGFVWRAQQQEATKRPAREAAIAHFEALGGTYKDKYAELHGLGIPEWSVPIANGACLYFASLNLCNTSTIDTDLEYMVSLPKLRQLLLENTKVTDAGMKHLAKQTYLTSVSLESTEVTDAGLKHLANHTMLLYLLLSDTGVTDDGLAHLKDLPLLLGLCLSNTKVTDSGLKHLANHTMMEHLRLSGTQVTDAGLVHLVNLNRLRILNLHKSQVTAEGVAAFERAHPNVTVVWGRATSALTTSTDKH